MNANHHIGTGGSRDICGGRVGFRRGSIGPRTIRRAVFSAVVGVGVAFGAFDFDRGIGVFPSATAAVWQADREWSEAEEQAYGHWVKTKFAADIFWSTGSYAGVSTDCADATYAMRMIYSYENRLPFAIQKPGAKGQFITNRSAQFDAIRDPDKRFRAYLNAVLDGTNTTTLAGDTYPVAITRAAVSPGSIYLATGTHVYQIVDVTDGGIPVLQSSTVPREVRVMTRIETFPNYVPGDLKVKNRPYVDGFRRFKQPQMYAMPDGELPFYSLEQFGKIKELQDNGMRFYDWAQSRLATRAESMHERLTRSLFLVCHSAWDRGEAINRGYFAAKIKRIKNREEPCLTATEYDEYSTPTRDKRLKDYFKQLHDIPAAPGYTDYNGEMKVMINQIIGIDRSERGEALVLQWCDVARQTGGGLKRPMSLAELHDLTLADRLVSDPHATPDQRWGLESFTPECKQY